MEKITYGVSRLMDWVAQIKSGNATVKVHFTGGALTSYGITPAEYTTSSPFIQKVIEQSSYFKEGRITILRRATLDSVMPAKAAKPKPQTKTEPQTPAPSPVPETQAAPQPVEDTTSEEAVAEEVADNSDEADSGLTQVEVSCLQDAQAYLQEQFNIASYKVRSYEAVQKAAAEHGIQFTGGKFYPAYADGDTTAEEEE